MAAGSFDFVQDRLDNVFKVLDANVVNSNPFDFDKNTRNALLDGYVFVKQAQIWLKHMDRMMSGDLPNCAGPTMVADIKQDMDRLESYKIRQCRDCVDDDKSCSGTGPCEKWKLDDFDDIPF
jgi:hypothetical protein